MLDNIIQYEALREITENEWMQLKDEYTQQKNAEEKKTFIKKLALCSGVSKQSLENFFKKKNLRSIAQDIDVLDKEQQLATKRIEAFLKRTIIKDMNVVLPRSILNQLITMFNTKEKRALHATYFYRTLSQIAGIRFSELMAVFKERLLNRSTSARSASSRNREYAIKRQRLNFSRSDDMSNSFIINNSADSPTLLGPIKEMTSFGVSYAPLLLATPEKGGNNNGSEFKTPRGTRADIRFSLNSSQGTFAFYQRRPSQAPLVFSLDDEQFDEQLDEQKRKKLAFRTALPIQFTATLNSLSQQQGVRRQGSGRAIMGISAFEVFRAHGLTEWNDNCNHKHWSHLIARFLADEVDLKSPIKSSKPLVNLVPTTASANYATLSVIEIYIKELLVSKKSDAIDILVTPVYESWNIPSKLTYQLSYMIQQQPVVELFNVYPLSKANCSPQELKAIKAARNAMLDEADEFDDPYAALKTQNSIF